MPTNNYKRMAKNASMLYIRMLLTMAVTLYTSRVIMQTLGVEDFGIYNVVAGFVTMLGFLHGAMSSATQRFIAFELGQPDIKNLPAIFSMSMNIHILIAFIVLILGETIGLWFVKTQMNIPHDRMLAAEWVFHLSILSFIVTIVSVPYNALIIAHEQMSIFAAVSVVDVLLKLMIVFMLNWFGLDKLILYALLSLAVTTIIFLVYRNYCKYKFNDSKFIFYWDKKLFHTMTSYTGWNLWGNIASVMSNQGTNILLNIFFGPAVNAARAIAMQVSNALNSFVQNIQVAINPQIIKSYSSNDMRYMHRLVSYGSKYNLFLLFLLSMPVLLNINIILEFWLGITPKYTSIFVQLMIVNILIDCVSRPLMTAAQATGKIKLYQSVVGGLLLLNLPLSYFILKHGAPVYSVIYVSIAISVIAFISRLVILDKLISLPIKHYLKEVIGRGSLVIGLSVITLQSITIYLKDDLNIFESSVLTLLITFIFIAFFGLDKTERQFITKNIKALFIR